MFAPVLDSRFPLPLEETADFDKSPASPPKEPDVVPQAREDNTQAKYSTIVKMGLFFSVPSHLSPVLHRRRSHTISRYSR
jgi:hypothetical protein